MMQFPEVKSIEYMAKSQTGKRQIYGTHLQIILSRQSPKLEETKEAQGAVSREAVSASFAWNRLTTEKTML